MLLSGESVTKLSAYYSQVDHLNQRSWVEENLTLKDKIINKATIMICQYTCKSLDIDPMKRGVGFVLTWHPNLVVNGYCLYCMCVYGVQAPVNKLARSPLNRFSNFQSHNLPTPLEPFTASHYALVIGFPEGGTPG